MSAVEDVDAGLRVALDKLAKATGHLDTAQALWEESGTGLSVLVGTNDAEAQDALACHCEGGEQLARAQEMLRGCAALIRQYQPRVDTTSASAPPRDPHPRADRSRPPRPQR